MTGPCATLLWSFLAAFGFDPPPSYWADLIYDSQPDTPASDLVMVRYPYAVAKRHARGPNARTELIDCESCTFLKCGIHFGWVQFDGLPRPAICDDAHKTALVGTWLVIQDQQGNCCAFNMTDREKVSAWTDLDGVNAHLDGVGAPPVSDSDFRTFEELVEERDRQRVKWSLVGLAVTLLPLAGGVLVAVIRSRSNAGGGCGVHS